MNKSLKLSMFKTFLMAVLMAAAFGVQGAGLGKLSVHSGVGQQLNAEIELSATPAELHSMTVKLASPEAFREAGIEYSPVLSDVRISLEKNSSGQPVLKLTTVRPISEPLLHLLLELSWASGRVIREYTFMLDPPQPLQVTKPASERAPAATGEYPVKPGDTLFKIARETRHESVTLDQMLLALFESNREAFSGNNMNRLRAGKILRIPDADEAGKVDPAEARKLVISHAVEFDAYRNRLAGAVASAPPRDAGSKQEVAGTIKPRVEDKIPAPAVQDKLEVSRTEPAKAATPATGRNFEEDLIAHDKALREVSERIALLEKNIENLRKLVEMKSQAGVNLQSAGEPAPPGPAVKPAEPDRAETPVMPSATPAAVPEAVAEAAAPVEEAKPAAPPAASPAAPPPLAPPESEQEHESEHELPPPGFVAQNPELVYGGGALIALLLGYLGYLSWRRKKARAGKSMGSAVAAPMAAGAEQAKAAPVSETPTARFDASDVPTQENFSEGAPPVNKEGSDPVAVADVLMAYGRDRQAEEILLEGLHKDPSRQAIHMKLLELYAKQKNLPHFESVAGKLHVLCNGRGADWERTLVLARTLGLTGGLFAGASALAEVVKPVTDSLDLPITNESQPAPEAPEAPKVSEAPGVPKVGLAETQLAPPTAGVDEFAQEAPIAGETSPLEFDLDLGEITGDGVAETVSANEPAEAGKPAADENLGLDFDLDLESLELQEAVAAAEEKADTAGEINLAEMDFDLDLGSPAESEAGPPDVPPADSAMPDTAGSPAAAVESAPIAGGLADLKLDFDLDLDLDLTDQESSDQESLAERLPESDTSTAPPVFDQPDNPEAATKLELAQAYEEMGDLEGALELLNEVINEGSESQQAQARAKLDQLRPPENL